MMISSQPSTQRNVLMETKFHFGILVMAFFLVVHSIWWRMVIIFFFFAYRSYQANLMHCNCHFRRCRRFLFQTFSSSFSSLLKSSISRLSDSWVNTLSLFCGVADGTTIFSSCRVRVCVQYLYFWFSYCCLQFLSAAVMSDASRNLWRSVSRPVFVSPPILGDSNWDDEFPLTYAFCREYLHAIRIAAA